jgi:hypothetical protein
MDGPSLCLLEATPGFEPGIRALQAPALPLGHVASRYRECAPAVKEGRPSGPVQLPFGPTSEVSMERTTGFEPATPTLARLCSTS